MEAIQISLYAKIGLESMMKKEKIKSFDEMILKLIEKHNKIPKSMFGSLKTGKKWDKYEIRGPDREF